MHTIDERTKPQTGPRRLHVEITGAVQGVGFRPFVYRLATLLELCGWVINDTQGVIIEVEGTDEHLVAFLARLPADAPPIARIADITHRWLPYSGFTHFEIRHSEHKGARRVVVMPDLATCPECKAELFSPANRRYHYPFINCTNCGPRFTIVEALPYDRPNTTMKGFALCPSCRTEYDDPRNRRFHAQPNACRVCGPQVALYVRRAVERNERPGEGERGSAGDSAPPASGRWPAVVGAWVLAGLGEDAVAGAVRAIRDGQIAAVKGLGGFHLMADAADQAAVERLRIRKARPDKPLAVMAPDLEQMRGLCTVTPDAGDLLLSGAAPIVLLPRRPHAAIVENVAPGNPDLGVMLPYTPLHHLLMAELRRPLVATSGNLSDEPICIDEWEAFDRLGAIADCFLIHDRPIARHADDSVVWYVDGAPQFLRRARGYAPLPVRALRSLPTILGVGAHLKNTVALSVDEQVFISQHIGDLESVPAFDAFQRVIADFLRLYEAEPVAIAHDMHPEYLSTKWAVEKGREGEGETRRQGDKELDEHRTFSSHPLSLLPPPVLVPVQHHHAHLAACLADNGVNEPALGLIWDGTGYGPDGVIWGGECLLGDARSYERVAHLRTFRLPGGDAAIREPRRTALALLWELYGDEAFHWEWLAPVRSFAEHERGLLGAMLVRGINAPHTTSMGRLFDGIAALIGLRQTVTFEGQAAIDLEHCAVRAESSAYPFAFVEHTGLPAVTDWGEMIDAIVVDLRHGIEAGVIAARFHNTLVEIGASSAAYTAAPRVALSGGCFQNRRLTEQLASRLRDARIDVLLHRQVPPNDGSISLGQVVVAAAALER